MTAANASGFLVQGYQFLNRVAIMGDDVDPCAPMMQVATMQRLHHVEPLPTSWSGWAQRNGVRPLPPGTASYWTRFALPKGERLMLQTQRPASHPAAAAPANA